MQVRSQSLQCNFTINATKKKEKSPVILLNTRSLFLYKRPSIYSPNIPTKKIIHRSIDI